MIRAVDYQKVDMTDEEFDYYKKLIGSFENGKEYFNGLLKTNENGVIYLITPTKPIPWDIMFFVQNLMINQHLREFDVRLSDLEKKE